MPRLKTWQKIHPTLIGSDYNRYEIIKYESNTFSVYVKNPQIGMEGCDRCAGPHRIKNKTCSKTRNKEPHIPGPAVGIYLYNLLNGQRLPATWQLQNLYKPDGRKSGIAELVKLQIV
tara:strand:- start:727 stop:1077 length:351 start_codon:yes stop_codon:yes gene_type:complete